MRRHSITLLLALAPLARAANAQYVVEWSAASGALPSEVAPAFEPWEIAACGPSSVTFAGGALRVDSSGCAQNIHAYQYARTAAQWPSPPPVYWAEADLCVRSVNAANIGFGAGTLRVYPGPSCPYQLDLEHDAVTLRYFPFPGGMLAQAAVDTTSTARTWRIEVDFMASEVRAYVDGQLLLSAPTVPSNTCSFVPGFWGGVSFGDLTQGQGGVVDWYAVRHNLGLAERQLCAFGTLNSAGRIATLATSGSRSVAANAFTLHVLGAAPNAFGYFLCSRGTTPASPVAAGQGTLCLAAPIGRLNRPGEVLVTSGQGNAALALDLTRLPQPNGTAAVLVGERWSFQLWYRDANPTPTSNLSQGLEVLFE